MINYAPGCAAVVSSHAVSVMVETFNLSTANEPIKKFDLGQSVLVDSVYGTLSYYGLNWGCWSRLVRRFGFQGGVSTAICGWIGCENGNLLTFDIQGRGDKPLLIPVYAAYGNGVKMSQITFDLYDDLAHPTDFRAALIFHRVL